MFARGSRGQVSGGRSLEYPHLTARNQESRDIEEFYIERTEKHSFTKDEEWLQTEVRRRIRRLHMEISFPKKRRCQRAVLLQRSHNRITVLGPNYLHQLPDGRQLLTWETTNVRPYDIYTLRWQW
jgi:hypothetical protein